MSRAQHAAPLQRKFHALCSSSGGLCGADERFDHGAENDQAIGGAESEFHGALGMGHQTGNVAFAVADSGDIVNRAVGIAGVVIRTVGRSVAEYNLTILFEFGHGSFVAIVIAVGVRDGNLEDLSLLRGVGEGRVRLFDADVDVAADEAQAAVAHHRAGEQARFAENLEAVANSQDHAAALGEFLDRFHDRGKARDGAGAQIIAVGKSTGQDDSIAIRKIFGLVPDKFDRLVKDVADGVKRVVVAIGPGENDNSKFHVVPAPCAIAGASILAHARSANAWRPFWNWSRAKTACYLPKIQARAKRKPMRTKIPRIA